MDDKRQAILDRAIILLGPKAGAKSDKIKACLKTTYDIDQIDYTDAMIVELLNDVVYDKEENNLFARYIVPPFSVFDTKQKYWIDRREQWLKVTGNLTETKKEVLGEGLMASINGGSSNFDPVLAEVIMKWFNVKNGAVLDPFGGEQTKGVISGALGLEYYGCEIRQDQVDYNAGICKKYPNVHYVCGDSNDIDTLIEKREFDLVFTSPPYYDLEVYSEADLSSLGSYEEFMLQLENIYRKCAVMLARDRFFVVKVGEVRDKKTGEYRNFVGDTITIMKKIGLKYYDEFALINAVGTAPMRASNSFRTRKIVKLHQNVLVFFKGDPKNIPAHYEPIDAAFPVAELRALNPSLLL